LNDVYSHSWFINAAARIQWFDYRHTEEAIQQVIRMVKEGVFCSVRRDTATICFGEAGAGLFPKGKRHRKQFALNRCEIDLMQTVYYHYKK